MRDQRRGVERRLGLEQGHGNLDGLIDGSPVERRLRIFPLVQERRLSEEWPLTVRREDRVVGTSSYSSSLRNGGKPLRLAYPIHGRNTFRPSGNPEIDPPEETKESELDRFRRLFGVDTPAGARAWDREIADARGINGLASKDQCDYWDRVRFLQGKSPRAKKRAEERERRKQAQRTS